MMRDRKEGDDMTRVLLVGLLPETVDYSDPALPPGMNAKKIQAGIELGSRMAGRRMPDPTRCNGRSYCSGSETAASRPASAGFSDQCVARSPDSLRKGRSEALVTRLR